MKIKIAFTKAESKKAFQLARRCLEYFPKGTKTQHSDRHAPFYHIYIADKPGKKNATEVSK